MTFEISRIAIKQFMGKCENKGSDNNIFRFIFVLLKKLKVSKTGCYSSKGGGGGREKGDAINLGRPSRSGGRSAAAAFSARSMMEEQATRCKRKNFLVD